MKTKMSKKEYNFKKTYILWLIFGAIFLLSLSITIKFNKNVTPKLLNIAETSINKLNEEILVSYKVKNLFNDIDLKNIILINRNKNDEIINADFNLENVYIALSNITEYLQKELNSKETRQKILKYYSEDLSSTLDEIVLNIPIGVTTSNIYFSNMGPKIPVKVSYIGYLSTKIRLEVLPYGINNSLISIYVDATITNEFIIPNVEKEIVHTYSFLLFSEIIQGQIPSYYGGNISEKSNILNIPIS